MARFGEQTKIGKLTYAEVLFCHAYVSNGNIINKAAEAAGISEGRARKIVKEPHIVERMEQILYEKASEADLTTHKIIHKMMEIIEDPDTSDSSRVSALKYLGDCLGMSKTNLNLSGSVEGGQVVLYMPDNGRLYDWKKKELEEGEE